MINFCVIVYMDDILVYSETYHGQAQHIEWTLGELRDAGFKIALEKSEFFLSEILFLGYVVTRGGLRPEILFLGYVTDAGSSLLGLTSYYRRFIKGFAAIARPLTNLIRKDQHLSWDAECQQAFATLKDALATTPILIRSDPLKQFILITDCQSEAISAILAQKGNDGHEHVIKYASSTVPDERRNDSAPQEFRFATDSQVMVLAEATTFQRRAAPGVSHVSTVVVFSGDITAFDPARQAAIKSTLYKWGRDLATDWDRRLTRHGDECYPIDDIELPLDIISQSDEEPVPHVLSRALAPSLQWSACIEERWADGRFPSRSEYLDVHSLTNPRFFRQPTAFEWAALREEEEAEEESEAELRREAGEAAARLAEDEEEERKAEDEEEVEEETSEEEEEAYSEHSEGERSEEEENEGDNEGVESGEDDRELTHDDEIERGLNRIIERRTLRPPRSARRRSRKESGQ
ncbi:hypothetical protein CBR_g42036 [Chara braunii]|uniref:Reverse transcriptase domain-containing protein n=1 Tax=Chara braunii TaxID=69332 RepID=A0A388LX05_CHABU|nr:hypothetical protein CBR_g42036 [Chara braunii]|eukprot:GBG86752.1 hypothetical protein CBR_g42036 [Chara braunii]